MNPFVIPWEPVSLCAPKCHHLHHFGVMSEQNLLLRECRCQGCKVAKCFAKHIKVEEQRKLLDSLGVNIAVGTPHRMAMLAQLGSLKLERLRLVVLDMKVDPKQR